jgi:hypothetical protein
MIQSGRSVVAINLLRNVNPEISRLLGTNGGAIVVAVLSSPQHKIFANQIPHVENDHTVPHVIYYYG